MRLIILTGMILIVTLISLALVGRDASDELTMTALIAGPIMGLFAGLILLTLIGSRPRRRRRPRQPIQRPAQTSSPYRTRLAAFTHQDESEVMTETVFRSKMPFWIAVDFIRRVPPKSAKFIRRILERIHRLARHE